VRDTRKLASHLRSGEHVNSCGHEVEGLVKVAAVLIHKRPHVLLQLREDAIDRLQVGRVGRQPHEVDSIRLHVLVAALVVDSGVVVQDNARIRLHLPRETRDVRVHLQVETLQEKTPVIRRLCAANNYRLRPKDAMREGDGHHGTCACDRTRIAVAQNASYIALRPAVAVVHIAPCRVGLINRHDAAQGDIVKEHRESALGDEGALGVQPLNLLARVMMEAKHALDRRGAHITVVTLGEVHAERHQQVDMVAEEGRRLFFHERENGTR